MFSCIVYIFKGRVLIDLPTLNKEYPQSTTRCSTTWYISQLLQTLAPNLISRLAWLLLFYHSKDKG